MKLTEKDKRFLETLARLMAQHDLWVELRISQPSYMVLRGTYGDKVHRAFRTTRQGVRWRFQRIIDMYVSSFETILFIEKLLGSQLRHDAVTISRQRYELRRQMPIATFDAGSLTSGTEPQPTSSK